MARTSTKADRARALMAEGKTTDQIAAALGVTKQYVYSLRCMDKKKKPVPAPAKRKPGRPKGSKTKKVQEPSPMEPVSSGTITYIAPKRYTFTERLRILFTGSL